MKYKRKYKNDIMKTKYLVFNKIYSKGNVEHLIYIFVNYLCSYFRHIGKNGKNVTSVTPRNKNRKH